MAMTSQEAAAAAQAAAQSASQAAANAQAQADTARQAAEQAHQYADIASAAANAVSSGAIDPFVFQFSIFVLAVFVGYYVVWSVTPALHTPLMSVTNAISSVIVVGALLAVGVPLVGGDSGPVWARLLGFVALVFASVNIFGGFLVTQRMLGMYQKKKK
jgi:NAD(P) transhydrogenase subunit alpha